MTFREELFGLQYLGPLHVADFDGDVFDAAGDDTQRGEKRGVAVAGDDLRADRFGHQTQLIADMFLDAWVDICEGTDRAADRTGGNLSASVAHAGQVAVHLGVETREGQAHGGRLRVDSVAAADADGFLMLIGAAFQGGQQTFEIGDQDVGGAGQLHVEAGVQHVGRGHALMHKARLVAADMFGQMGQEGDDIVFGDSLDLINAGHVEFHVLGFPHGLCVLARDHAQIGHRIAGMGFDLVPDAELGLGRPDGNHFGAGIAGNHWRQHLFVIWLEALARGLNAPAQGNKA